MKSLNKKQLDLFLDHPEHITGGPYVFQPVSTLSFPKRKDEGKLPEVTQSAITQALKLLNAARCTYKIIDTVGNEYGTLETAQPKKRHHNREVEHGAYSKHYRPYVDNLAVGDVAVIPIDKFKYVKLLGSLSAWCSTKWGKGNTKTCRAGDTIQVLRCG